MRKQRSPLAALPKIVISEQGSQYTLVIGRILRELGFRSVIVNHQKLERWLKRHRPQAIILSGSRSSVYDEDAPRLPASLLRRLRGKSAPVPVLGICYGQQRIAHDLGGHVAHVPGQSAYGPEMITWDPQGAKLFRGTPVTQRVWMSHGDSVTRLPVGFEAIAHAESGAIAAISDGGVFVGTQFHPEVIDTEHGREILRNFVVGIAGCQQDWIASNEVASIRTSTLQRIGPTDNAVFGFSGGVDSSTIAALCAPGLGKRLLAVTIDGGQLQEREIEEIKASARLIGVQHRIIRARGLFAKALAGVVDAERRRKIFKRLYTRLLKKAAREFGASWLIQGTLATDKIESGATGGAVIKSHHNVGNKTGTLKQLHPLDHLFKYEVRDLARALGLPESICEREPSPGPGNFLRVLGVSATPARLKIVRWGYAGVRAILREHGIPYSQLVVAYCGVPVTGVRGDARVYAPTLVVRAVRTVDFMTAEGVVFPEHVIHAIKGFVAQNRALSRVLFDFTDKPPGTIEFQ